jgi:anthranilate phosphoribosyltransferase
MLKNAGYTLLMTLLTWPQVLAKLLDGGDLGREEAAWAMGQIMGGEATPGQIGAFMIALRSKGETVQELAGLVDVMLQNALLLETGDDAVDIVGTGGDLVGTVNISSMASVLTAAAGVPVLKHGSRSASGKTGSSEMLEVLGIRLDLAPQQVSQVFKEAGITFFFAPVFHPAMRHVAPIRRELGIPTTFNFLGPLANPAQPIATAMGVSNPELAPLMAQEMANRGRSALVFRSHDGLDELSTTAANDVWQVASGEVSHMAFDAQEIGLPRVSVETLIGADAQHNAKVASSLFEGQDFPNAVEIAQMVALNAAAGIVSYELAKDPQSAATDLNQRLAAGYAKASAALLSGAAMEKLTEWSAATQRL